MAAPTAEEIPILEQFRKEISDLTLRDDMQTDIALLSWLRARDLSIPKANEMLRKSLEWRKAHDLDSIQSWIAPAHYKTEYDFEIVGNDAEGHPICVVPFGAWDVRKVVNSGERDTWLRYMDKVLAGVIDKAKEISVSLNKEVTQFICIVDFANFSMKQLTSLASVDTILEVARRFEANYPETIYTIYVVNASRIFTMLFALVKPILSTRTLSKIQIYGSPSKWKHILQRDIPLNQLPLEFGGVRGGRRVSIGSTPYVDKGLAEGVKDFVTLKIGAGQKIDLEFDVQNPGTRITWTFKTDSHDIGFSVTRDRRHEVYAYRRYDAQLSQESDEIICDEPGEYFLTFDNSYSKMREKTVHYLIDIVAPAGSDDDIIDETDE